MPSCLITGCSKDGIGHTFALALARRGWLVFATARKIESMQGLKEAGCRLLVLDVTQPDSIQRAVESVSAETNGTLNLLINNAGNALRHSSLLDVDIDAAKLHFDTKVWGVLRITQAFAPLLAKASNLGQCGGSSAEQEERATILNISSVSGIRASPYAAIYGSGKASLNALSDGLRGELAGLHISVTVVISGIVESKILDNMLPVRAASADTTSIYANWQALADKFWTSRLTLQKKATPREEFVESVLRQVVVANPPPYIWTGAYAGIYKIMSSLPSWLSDKHFHKSSLSDEVEYAGSR